MHEIGSLQLHRHALASLTELTTLGRDTQTPSRGIWPTSATTTQAAPPKPSNAPATPTPAWTYETPRPHRPEPPPAGIQLHLIMKNLTDLADKCFALCQAPAT